MDPQIPHYVTFIPVGYPVLGMVTPTNLYPDYMNYYAVEEELFGHEDEEDEEDEDINPVTTPFQGLSNNGTVPFNGNNGGELNRGEVDGLFCPICFNGSSSGGDHHVCCLPCGHIYGLSCIKKWLERPGSSKCPQCKKACQINDIRLLYATRVVALDGELQKKVKSLEAKCASLEKQGVEKEAEWKKKEDDFRKKIQFLTNIQQQAKQSLAVFQAEMQMRMQAQIDEHTYLMKQAHTFMFPPPPPPTGPNSMFPPPPPPGH